MREKRTYYPVNWIDGMKINKTHFIDQDNAWADALHEAVSHDLSSIRYGILPPSSDRESTFDVELYLENNTISVTVNSCQAITSGGVRISLPDGSGNIGIGDGKVEKTYAEINGKTDLNKSITRKFPYNNEPALWVFLFVNPFIKQAAGNQDLSENPPRYKNVIPTYSVDVVNETEFRQYDSNPYAMAIGKIVNGQVEKEFIPPCLSLESHPKLKSLLLVVDKFLTDLEENCSRIVMNVMKKEEPNEISQLLKFLCERMMTSIAPLITSIKCSAYYEPPVKLFAAISTLARVMLKSINLLAIGEGEGTGKDQLLNYMAKWGGDLQPGRMQTILEMQMIDSDNFSNNAINESRQKLVEFIAIISNLFAIISTHQFPGSDRRSGVFVDRNLGGTNQGTSNSGTGHINLRSR